MWRGSHIWSLFVLLLAALPAQAQERTARDVISVEARVVTGLDAPGASLGFTLPTADTGSNLPGLGQGSAGGQTGTAQAGVPAQPGTSSPGTAPADRPVPQPPAPSVVQVASQLMLQANNGKLNLADTTLAMAAGASRRQNVDALVSITVIGPDGNEVKKEAKTVVMPGNVLESTPGGTRGISPRSQGGLALAAGANRYSGEAMRREAGVYYFYVSVCACSL